MECAVPLGFRTESGIRPRSYRGWVGGYAIPFLRSCRGTRRTRTLRSSLLRCGERPGGHPDVASGRCGAGAHFQLTCPAEPAKDREGDSPLPFQFVMPVSRTQALPLLNRGRVFYLRGGGMVPSVVTSKPLARKLRALSVRDTGIEPVTSSVSGKRATAAPIALTKQLFCCEVRTGFEPAYTALQAAA